MPYTHHSHSGEFCKHAQGRLEDVVLEAIRQGFKVLGLSEHMPRYRPIDFYPEETELSVGDLAIQFEKYLDEAHRLKEKYAARIAILVGLETEHIHPADLDHLDALLQQHGDRIEYLVGSIHHANGVPIDFDIATFERALESFGLENEHTAREALLMDYFEAQYRLLDRFQPEVIGHFDLCRLYDPGLVLEDFPAAWSLAQRNIKYAVHYGALFEINASAFRKKWNTAYPGNGVIQGRFALSDDSHGPHAVGLHYDQAAKYLHSLGVRELWHLQKSDTLNVAGRTTRVVIVEGNWWEDEFWVGRLPKEPLLVATRVGWLVDLIW